MTWQDALLWAVAILFVVPILSFLIFVFILAACLWFSALIEGM